MSENNPLSMANRLPVSALMMPLAALMPILMAFALMAGNPEFETNPAVHWVGQLISAILLATCAFIIVRGRASSLNTYDYLLVTGLICAAILEAAHGLLIAANFRPEVIDRLIPWGWLPSRIVLPVLLATAVLHEYAKTSSAPLNRPLILTSVSLAIGFTVVSLLLLTLFSGQLPQIYYPAQTVHRPSELIPALLFFLAMAFQLRYGNWRGSIYDYIMLLALGLAVIAHSLLMPFAPGNFTNLFAAAVATKLLGYALFLAALIMRSRQDILAVTDSVRLRHQAIVETASDAILTFDGHGVIDSFNPAATRMFGYSESEAVGADITLLTPVELRQPHQDYLSRVRSGEFSHTKAFNYEAIGLRKDGEAFPVESSISEVSLNGRGHYTAIVRDITQRKAAQGRLEETSDRLTLALESAKLGMWEQDLETGKLTWNKRMFEIYERDRSLGEPDQLEWVGKTLPEDRELCFLAHEAATDRGDLIDIVYRIDLGEDRVRWVRANGKLVEGDAQRPRRLVGVNQDISESVEHLEEMETARLNADNANRAKSTFLATMSHEIRTPLNGVIGLTEVLHRTNLTDYQTELTRLIDQSASALSEIIEDVLDISKIEAGKLEIDPTEMVPAQLVESVSEMLANFARKSGVKLSLDLDPALPGTVYGDGQRLRQILTNLINNAIKFSGSAEHNGKVAVSVCCVEVTNDRATLEFSVTDNGIGMDEPTVSRLFSPFTQADASTSRQYGGSGLGLAISQRLAELMGGAISVTSELNQGSSFVVSLPFGLKQNMTQDTGWEPGSTLATDEAAGESSASTNRHGAIDDRPLILVAEDNETNQAVIEYQLNELGYQADIAGNGVEALKAWRAGDYDLLLTDLQMPEVDGYELARQVRDQEKPDHRIPIVALSANTLMDEKENCLKVGMDAFLSKPVALSNLKATLSQWLKDTGS